MNSFLGSYVNMTGYEIGNFRVEGLAGRDPSGAPCWRIVCAQCCYPQTLPHAKLAPLVQGRHSQITLLCANSACPLSCQETLAETFSQFRRREAGLAKQAADTAAVAQRAAEAEAEKARAQAARHAEIQREYIRYVNHQWLAGQEDAKICTQRRWFELTGGTRRTVLDLIEKDRTVRIAGL